MHPAKHHLSKLLNPTVEHIQADVMTLDPEWIASFDAVWASPPCQKRSGMNKHDLTVAKYAKHDQLLDWSLNLPNDVLWVENVVSLDNSWGHLYNGAQFDEKKRMLRTRVIGGRYGKPKTLLPYRAHYLNFGYNIMPTILASHWHRKNNSYFKSPHSGFVTDRAAHWFGRGFSVREYAYFMGFDIPDSLMQSWFYPLDGYTRRQWKIQLYEAIGNGVPVYMARAFAAEYGTYETPGYRQLPLFDELDVA